MTKQGDPGTTVYFLGAGASKSIYSGLPLASDLTLDNLCNPNSYGHQIGPTYNECRPLIEFLDSHTEWHVLRGECVEYILEKLRRVAPSNYELALDLLYVRLSAECYTSEPFSSFSGWLRSVRQNGDVIVTTNYDTLIENELMSILTDEYRPSGDPIPRCALHWLDFGVHKSKVYDYPDEGPWPTPPEQSVLLLKLHGSISWLFCNDCGTYLLDPVWQHAREASKLLHGYGPCPNCKNEGAKRDVVIVPPFPVKAYNDNSIQEIWGKAREALGRAEEIIFAGFSLDRTDNGVRELLKEALDRGSISRVTVVDANPSRVEENYRYLYGDIVNFAPELNWKQFLAKQFSAKGLPD